MICRENNGQRRPINDNDTTRQRISTVSHWKRDEDYMGKSNFLTKRSPLNKLFERSCEEQLRSQSDKNSV